MRKLLPLFVVPILAFALVACGARPRPKKPRKRPTVQAWTHGRSEPPLSVHVEQVREDVKAKSGAST
jgi:hypothetical protein